MFLVPMVSFSNIYMLTPNPPPPPPTTTTHLLGQTILPVGLQDLTNRIGPNDIWRGKGRGKGMTDIGRREGRVKEMTKREFSKCLGLCGL